VESMGHNPTGFRDAAMRTVGRAVLRSVDDMLLWWNRRAEAPIFGPNFYCVAIRVDTGRE
jgi:hypothetical protein